MSQLANPNEEGIVDGFVETKNSVMFMPEEADVDSASEMSDVQIWTHADKVHAQEERQEAQKKAKEEKAKGKTEEKETKETEEKQDKPQEKPAEGASGEKKEEGGNEEGKEETKEKDKPTADMSGLPKGAQKRITTLTRQKYEAQLEVEKHKAEAEKNKAEAERLKLELQKYKNSGALLDHEKQRPKETDFEDFEDFQIALGKWAAKYDRLQSVVEEAEKEQKQETKVTDKGVQQPAPNETPSDKAAAMLGHLKRATEFGKEAYSDFEETVFNPTLPLSTTVVDEILPSKVAHEVLYHLAKHPDEAAALSSIQDGELLKARIAAMSVKFLEDSGVEDSTNMDISEEQKPVVENEAGPDSVNQEPGNVSQTPAVQSASPQKKVTNAPPPIVPLAGKTVTSKDPSKMSNEEYRSARGYDRWGNKVKK